MEKHEKVQEIQMKFELAAETNKGMEAFSTEATKKLANMNDWKRKFLMASLQLEAYFAKDCLCIV